MNNGVYLFSISGDDLKSLIQEAVTDAIQKNQVVKERLTKAEACRRLGVSFNTLQKMLCLSGRDFIYADEVNSFKEEYKRRKCNV